MLLSFHTSRSALQSFSGRIPNLDRIRVRNTMGTGVFRAFNNVPYVAVEALQTVPRRRFDALIHQTGESRLDRSVVVYGRGLATA